MSKQTLASLKAAFSTPDREQRESLPNNYFPFWNMKAGQKAVVRFVPDKDENNVRGFLAEKTFHTLTINGQKKTVPCMTMYGEECPVCKVSQDYYKVKDEINGKKYWRKKQYIAQALVMEDPLPADDKSGETHAGKIRYIALGYQLYNIIKEAFTSDELKEVPYHLTKGYDFVIKKTEKKVGNNTYAEYTVGSKFKNEQRALDEEELAVVEEGMIELVSLLPKNPGVEKVQAMLNADLNGEAVEEDGEDEDAPVSRKPANTKSAVKASKVVDDDEDSAPVTKTAVVAEEGEGSDASTDVDAMLAAIRARRNKK